MISALAMINTSVIISGFGNYRCFCNDQSFGNDHCFGYYWCLGSASASINTLYHCFANNQCFANNHGFVNNQCFGKWSMPLQLRALQWHCADFNMPNFVVLPSFLSSCTSPSSPPPSPSCASLSSSPSSSSLPTTTYYNSRQLTPSTLHVTTPTTTFRYWGIATIHRGSGRW